MISVLKLVMISLKAVTWYSSVTLSIEVCWMVPYSAALTVVCWIAPLKLWLIWLIDWELYMDNIYKMDLLAFLLKVN